MPRSRLQEGPDRSHYHDTLGIAGTVPGGGVTVDNQSDPPTEVTTLIAPGAMIAGSEATLSSIQLRRIGPFRVNFDTPDITDVVKVADLESGVIVIRTWVETVTEWDSVAPQISVAVGGTDWAPENYDYTQTSGHTLNQAQEGVGWHGEAPAYTGAPEPRIVRLSTAGALVVGVVLGGGSATEGAADVYALIAEPAA